MEKTIKCFVTDYGFRESVQCDIKLNCAEKNI